MTLRGVATVVALGALGGLAACRDLSSYSTKGGRFEGTIAGATFTRAGLDAGTRACLTLDVDRFQSGPGTLSTSDGRFRAAKLRPIPQAFEDPIAMMTFGEGRIKNAFYAVSPRTNGGPDEADAIVVLSLLDSGDIEVRVVRGAPETDVDAAAAFPADAGVVTATTKDGPPLFGVFLMRKEDGACPF